MYIARHNCFIDTLPNRQSEPSVSAIALIQSAEGQIRFSLDGELTDPNRLSLIEFSLFERSAVNPLFSKTLGNGIDIDSVEIVVSLTLAELSITSGRYYFELMGQATNKVQLERSFMTILGQRS